MEVGETRPLPSLLVSSTALWEPAREPSAPSLRLVCLLATLEELLLLPGPAPAAAVPPAWMLALSAALLWPSAVAGRLGVPPSVLLGGMPLSVLGAADATLERLMAAAAAEKGAAPPPDMKLVAAAAAAAAAACCWRMTCACSSEQQLHLGAVGRLMAGSITVGELLAHHTDLVLSNCSAPSSTGHAQCTCTLVCTLSQAARVCRAMAHTCCW